MGRALRNISHIKCNTSAKKQGFSIIIPSAGEGVRMKAYGPKSLIKIDNGHNTILNNQLTIISQAFKQYQIVLIVGYEATKVMDVTPKDIIKIENEHFYKTNVSRSIGMGLRAIQYDKVVLIHGDLVFNPETLLNLNLRDNSGLLIDTGGLMSNNEINCTVSENYITHMEWDIGQKWSQIAYFTGLELELLKKITWNSNNSQCFTFETINKIIDNGGKFIPLYAENMKINDIDISKDLQAVPQILGV